MKKYVLLSIIAAMITGCASHKSSNEGVADQPTPMLTDSTAVVYMTNEVSPQALIRIYEALGVEAQGRVAVKISTGEKGGHNYLKPELIGGLVKMVDGTIVECNTAYWGKRDDTDEHWQTIKEHGFLDIAKVDILDEEGEMKLPVRDTTHIPYNIVGSHLMNYDFVINLSHFKGHMMGGYGGALKNQSIGFASSNGKILIHTAGTKDDAVHKGRSWKEVVLHTEQDDFLESMAAAAQSIADHFEGRIIYINVMNNLSVDCDCMPHPKDPKIPDVGILASTDPVALDKACVDIIFNMKAGKDCDPEPLKERILKKHGIHTIDYAAHIGLGTKNYKIKNID